jgi:hypothetical protein
MRLVNAATIRRFSRLASSRERVRSCSSGYDRTTRSQAMYACNPGTGGGFSRGCAHPAMQPPFSATHPHPVTRNNRSPGNGTPARRGSLAALPWRTLQLRVKINHHSPSARAPLACHPHAALNVVHTTLEASHADALLIGTRLCSGHNLTP